MDESHYINIVVLLLLLLSLRYFLSSSRAHYSCRYSALGSQPRRSRVDLLLFCGGHHFRAHKSFLMGDQSAHYIILYVILFTPPPRLTWKKKIKRYMTIRTHCTSAPSPPPKGAVTDRLLVLMRCRYNFIAVVGLV